MSTFSHDLLALILAPMVKLAFKVNVGYRDFCEVARILFVKNAQEHMRASGEKINVSRIAVKVGLPRNDVTRILKNKLTPSDIPGYKLTSRVVAAWENNPKYRHSNGRPKALSFQGSNDDFSKLVASVSKIEHPRLVLKELLRLNVIAVKEDTIILQKNLQYSDRMSDRYEVMADDLESLASASHANISEAASPSHLHLRTEFDNIPASRVPELRRWLTSEGKKFHEKVRKHLARFDRDIVSTSREQQNEASHQISITSFEFDSPSQD